MATLHVSISKARLIAGGNGGEQVLYSPAPVISAALTTSASAASTSTIAAATSATKEQQGKLIARCNSVDAAHYVNAGGTASATAGYYVPTGAWIDIAVSPGAEISAVTA